MNASFQTVYKSAKKNPLVLGLKTMYDATAVEDDIVSDPRAFQADQKDLIERLRERTQHPPFGPFRFQDLVWTPHVSSGNGRCNTHYDAVIQWKRLDDFVVGEQTNEVFPCKFTKDVILQNRPNSLSNPRANNADIAIR
jgi:hypothetical protein